MKTVFGNISCAVITDIHLRTRVGLIKSNTVNFKYFRSTEAIFGSQNDEEYRLLRPTWIYH